MPGADGLQKAALALEESLLEERTSPRLRPTLGKSYPDSFSDAPHRSVRQGRTRKPAQQPIGSTCSASISHLGQNRDFEPQNCFNFVRGHVCGGLPIYRHELPTLLDAKVVAVAALLHFAHCHGHCLSISDARGPLGHRDRPRHVVRQRELQHNFADSCRLLGGNWGSVDFRNAWHSTHVHWGTVEIPIVVPATTLLAHTRPKATLRNKTKRNPPGRHVPNS